MVSLKSRVLLFFKKKKKQQKLRINENITSFCLRYPSNGQMEGINLQFDMPS